MKRIIVQANLMAVGILVLAIGALAQGSQQYRANIPFDFEAAGKQNPAGTYALGVLSLTSQGAVAITNIKNGKSAMLGINARPGNGDWDKPGKLVFHKVNGAYRLSEISTATFSMKMRRTRTNVREVAGGGTPHEEVVTINLN